MRELGRLNTAGPARKPIQYPSKLPRIAAIGRMISGSAKGGEFLKLWVASSSPALNSNVSPGRKKPISSPHSANRITARPIVPYLPINVSGLIGLASTVVARACMGVSVDGWQRVPALCTPANGCAILESQSTSSPQPSTGPEQTGEVHAHRNA